MEASRVAFGLLVICALGACQTVPTEVVQNDTLGPALAGPSENEPGRLGQAHLDQGDYGLAQRQFQDAVEKNPDDGTSWIGLAAAYDNLGRFDLADRAYRQAIRTEGETLEILNNLGYSNLLRGNRRSATTYFKRALKLSPGNSVILNNIRLLELRQRSLRSTPL